MGEEDPHSRQGIDRDPPDLAGLTLAVSPEALMDARPRVIAALAAQFRDIDLAEEAYAEAEDVLLVADEPPLDVGAWMFVSAKRKAIDIMRRQKAEERALVASGEDQPMADIITLPDPFPDDRLRLLFICCHPALAIEARAALALKVVCGVSVADIARAFLVAEPTMYQRITRAKAKIKKAGIPFEVPPRRLWPERIEAILMAFECAYVLRHQDASDEGGHGELAADIERLCAMLVELVPDHPEALGLAALVSLTESRASARVDAAGMMIPLSEQDVTMWDGARIARAQAWMDEAARQSSLGPYQVMATIQLVHAMRYFGRPVDHGAIAKAYDGLMMLRPDRVVAVNRALAIGAAHGASAGLDALEEVASKRLENFRPFHVAKAHLNASAGNVKEAVQSYDRALYLGPARSEKLFLEGKRNALMNRQ